MPRWPKDELAESDERTTLLGFLQHQRKFLEFKVRGVSEAAAREATCPPSDLTLLGLVCHLTDVERGWSQRGLAGRSTSAIYSSRDDPDADFHPSSDVTIDSALERLWSEVGEAEAIYAEMDLDDVGPRERPVRYSLRWVLVHLIEEYARHLGHADLIREAIDGQVGDPMAKD